MARSVPLSRFTSRVGGGSAFFVRHHYTLMKYTIPFILLIFLLVGCNRRDATIQRELTGTWHRDVGGFQVTNVIAADGSYQVQVVGLNNITVGTSEGSLIAKNGVLIDTMTKNSVTNVQTPKVVQWQIVRIDKRELVMSSTFNTDKGALVKTYEKVER